MRLPCLPTGMTLLKQIFTDVDGGDSILVDLPLLLLDSLNDIGKGDDIEQFPIYLAGSVQR